METDILTRDTLNWIIGTYEHMHTDVRDVPTLLFERWYFTKDDVRKVIGLGPDEDLMEGLSAFLEEEFGICDLH